MASERRVVVSIDRSTSPSVLMLNHFHQVDVVLFVYAASFFFSKFVSQAALLMEKIINLSRHCQSRYFGWRKNVPLINLNT